MKKVFASLLVLLVLFGVSIPQSESDDQKFLNAFDAKVHRLDIYYQVLPVVFTKPQLRDVLLAIEKGRENVRKVYKAEAKLESSLSPDVDAALQNCDQKGAVPPMDLVMKLYNAQNARKLAEFSAADDNTDAVVQVLNAKLNAGQLKAMANSLNPRDFPDVMKNPDKVTQDDKVRLFARMILLDPDAYPILVKMSE